jgi:hypothetical protein
MDEADRSLDDLMNILSKVISSETVAELRGDLRDLADPSKSLGDLAAKWLTDAHHD